MDGYAMDDTETRLTGIEQHQIAAASPLPPGSVEGDLPPEPASGAEESGHE